MGRKVYWVVGITAVAVVVCAAVWLIRSGDVATEADAPASASRRLVRNAPSNVGKTPADAVREAMRGMEVEGAVRTRKLRPLRPPADLFAGLSGEDRRLAETVYDALESDDLSATLAAATKALASTNAGVRSHAVEALSWFGADALPELTEAMTDPDDDVADAAENAWEVALAEVGKPERRFAIAAAALGTLSNEDHLGTIAGHLSGAALEMVDSENDEKKATEKRITVVQTLVDLIADSGEAGSAEAKEAYEDITGNEWRGFDEAERYVQDPENYELPEDREEVTEEEDDDGADDDEDSRSATSQSRSRPSNESTSSRSSSSSSSSSSSRSSRSSGYNEDAFDGGEAEDALPEEEGLMDESMDDADSELEGDGEEALNEDGESLEENEEGGEFEEEEDAPPAPVLVN